MYCEDEVISRIDYGKNKYGGPVTTKQVEDVNMFYETLQVVRILAGELMAAVVLTFFSNCSLYFPTMIKS